MKDFDMKRFEKIVKVAERAEKELSLTGTRMDLLMDLEFASDVCPMDFDALLASDSENFAHDVYGIRNHFNRETKKLEDCFSPRFAKRGN